MRHYCTYFDRNYLTRGLALHESLERHAGDFELVVLCMDEAAAAALRTRALPRVRLLPLAELVAQYPALAAARANRTDLEFYFTCTSWLMRHLLPRIPAGELLTYLDADLYFFASPQPVYDEIGAASVAITPHRFPPALAHLARYGSYNVGWVSFRHDATGLACAADWADRCAEWCFNRLEGDRYADQKYLDAWAGRFPGTVSLGHPGVNAAPWNIRDCAVTAGPSVDGRPLIFYHFHALLPLGRQLFDPSLHKYDAALTAGLREHVYLPYLRRLAAFESPAPADQPELLPPVRPDDPRCGLAVPHLLQRLQASELDRGVRLVSIQFHQDKLKAAYDDLARNEAYLKTVEQDSRERLASIQFHQDKLKAAYDDLARNEAYLKSVEQDRAERLASIQFLQEKLKTAYDDLARNVAYLKTLESEIAAHVQAGAEKDALIARLHEQLRLAGERRLAGS